MALVFPGLGEIGIGEHVGPVVEGMAVAVDRDAIGLAVPGADRSFQVADIIVHVDLRLDPVGHFGGEALATDVALERRSHFEDVEVDGVGRDRLLQARIVIGLGQIDPGDLGAGIGFPWLEETAEQHVVEVLVVRAHEGNLDALELTLFDVLLGGAERHLAHFLPMLIGGRTGADAGDLENLGAHIGLRHGLGREEAEAARGSHSRRRNSALQNGAAIHFHQPVVDFHFH